MTATSCSGMVVTTVFEETSTTERLFDVSFATYAKVWAKEADGRPAKMATASRPTIVLVVRKCEHTPALGSLNMVVLPFPLNGLSRCRPTHTGRHGSFGPLR